MSNEAGSESISTALVEQAGSPTPLELAQDQAKFLAIAEKLKLAVRAVDTLIISAIGIRCNPKDFVRHGDGTSDRETFYLQASGCFKIAPFFGIYHPRRPEIITEPLGKDERTGFDHYNYEVTGPVGSHFLDRMMGTDAVGGTVIECFGSRSSRDPFFCKNDREPDQNDVKKSALANFEARAISGLIGLRNLTRADLQKFGIDPEKVTGVAHQTGAEGGGQTTLISEAQGKRLYAIWRGTKVDDADMRALLGAYGFESSNQITRDKYEAICAAAQGGPAKVKAKLADLSASSKSEAHPTGDEAPEPEFA